MAKKKLYIDPDHLAGQAPKFREIAANMNAAVTKLQAELNKFGDFWGNDETGQKFAENYVKNKNDDFDVQKETVQHLLDIADACEANAQNYLHASGQDQLSQARKNAGL